MTEKDLSDYLEEHTRTQEGQVSLEEFAKAMAYLKIKITQPQVKAIYKYLMAKYKTEDLSKV